MFRPAPPFGVAEGEGLEPSCFPHGPVFETGCRPVGAAFLCVSRFLRRRISGNWRDRGESNPHHRRDKPACLPLHHDPVSWRSVLESNQVGHDVASGLQPAPAPYGSNAPGGTAGTRTRTSWVQTTDAPGYATVPSNKKTRREAGFRFRTRVGPARLDVPPRDAVRVGTKALAPFRMEPARHHRLSPSGQHRMASTLYNA